MSVFLVVYLEVRREIYSGFRIKTVRSNKETSKHKAICKFGVEKVTIKVITKPMDL